MALSRQRPLSDREIKGLTSSRSVGGAPGLECVVTPAGTKSWRLLYRLSGDTSAKRRSLGLGRYPTVSLSEARERANEALSLASNGVDPKTARAIQVENNDRSLGDVASRYLDWCVTANSAGTVEDKRSLFRTHIVPALGHHPVRSVTRQDIVALLDGLACFPARKRAAYSYLRHFLGWALERNLITDNPCLGVRAPKLVAARDRILADAEIRQLWAGEGVFADIARLSLLTAQRRGSIEAMRWADLDLKAGTWTIPAAAMKSGKLHEVPLSAIACDIIKSIPARGEYVFGVGSEGKSPYRGASNGMDGLRRQLFGDDWREDQDLAPWRLHDARRTAVTLAQKGGAMVEEIRALTQHKTPGVIGVYARHAYTAEKRRVVDTIAAQVVAIVQSRKAPDGEEVAGVR